MSSETELKESLRRYFGHQHFRDGQERAIRNVLKGKDTLVVLPTGMGKSLCYQLPAMLLPGLTMVVSPLIALMKDQVDDLIARNLPATFINSSISAEEQNRRLLQVMQKKTKILYVAPERFRVSSFMAFLNRLDVSLLAVDEAHCISFWGHDFRPDYLLIKDVIKKLGNPCLIAVTATATKQVQVDILNKLELSDCEKIVTGFNRPNLTFRVFHVEQELEKYNYLKQFLLPRIGSAIIYVSSRRKTEEIAQWINEECDMKAESYHAGMSAKQRTHVQDVFMSNKVQVIVATNAFGMGVDKPDIRLVLHFSLPGTLESYYQEAGRAGRDGRRAGCILLYSPYDCEIQEWFIENSSPTIRELADLYYIIKTETDGKKAIVKPTDLQMRSGMDAVKLAVCLRYLENAEAIKNNGADRGCFKLDIFPLVEKKLQRIAKIIQEWRLYKYQMLQQMVDYAERKKCRRRVLLDHFGDNSRPDAMICCDYCEGKKGHRRTRSSL